MRASTLAKAAVAALKDIKGRDIVVLDVRKMTPLFDRVIIASADSTRQIRALSTHLQEQLKARGVRIRGVEGGRAADWMLVDLGPVIVHIMLPAVRKYYNLEELWAPPRARRRRAGAAA
jgi:ribosome-associated protein